MFQTRVGKTAHPADLAVKQPLPKRMLPRGMTPTEIHSRLYLMGAATLGGIAVVVLAAIGLAALMR